MKNIIAQLRANLAEIPKYQSFILIALFHLLNTPRELLPELADRTIFFLQIYLDRISLREEKKEKTKAQPYTNDTSLSKTVFLQINSLLKISYIFVNSEVSAEETEI